MQTDFSPADGTTDLQYDQPNDRYVFHHDTDGTATLTTTVVHALASIADTDVSQGEFSLYDSVDPDALDELFAPTGAGSPRMSGPLQLHVWGHDVTVYSTGQIVITAPRRD